MEIGRYGGEQIWAKGQGTVANNFEIRILFNPFSPKIIRNQEKTIVYPRGNKCKVRLPYLNSLFPIPSSNLPSHQETQKPKKIHPTSTLQKPTSLALQPYVKQQLFPFPLLFPALLATRPLTLTRLLTPLASTPTSPPHRRLRYRCPIIC